MTQSAWLVVSVALLVGCGGQVEQAPAQSNRIDLDQRDIIVPPPPPPPPPHREPLDTPPPPPAKPASDEVPPTKPIDEQPVVQSGPCRSILVDETGVHLATITFRAPKVPGGIAVGVDLALREEAATSITSLGRQGDLLYACSLGKVIRIALADGAIERSEIGCDAVTADDDAIWLQSSERGALERYPDFAAVLAGEPSATFEPVAPRIGVHGSVVVGTVDGPQASTMVVRFDSATGAYSDPERLPLMGIATRGVDIAADGSLYFAYEARSYAVMTAAGNYSAYLWNYGPPKLQGIVCE